VCVCVCVCVRISGWTLIVCHILLIGDPDSTKDSTAFSKEKGDNIVQGMLSYSYPHH